MISTIKLLVQKPQKTIKVLTGHLHFKANYFLCGIQVLQLLRSNCCTTVLVCRTKRMTSTIYLLYIPYISLGKIHYPWSYLIFCQIYEVLEHAGNSLPISSLFYTCMQEDTWRIKLVAKNPHQNVITLWNNFVFFPKTWRDGVIIRKSNNMCTCSIMGVFVVFFIKPTKCYRWLNPWSMVYNTKIGYDNFKI